MFTVSQTLRELADIVAIYDANTNSITVKKDLLSPELEEKTIDYSLAYAHLVDFFFDVADSDVWKHYLAPSYLRAIAAGTTPLVRFTMPFKPTVDNTLNRRAEVFIERVGETEVLIASHEVDVAVHESLLPDLEANQRANARIVRHRRINVILDESCDHAFQYDPDTEEVMLFDDEAKLHGLARNAYGLEELVDVKVLSADALLMVRTALNRVAAGKKRLSIEVQMRFPSDDVPAWYKLALYDYVEPDSGKRMVLGYVNNIEKIVQTRQELEWQASVDPLTGILNARVGLRRILSQLDMAAPGAYCALILIDIDNFKMVNDTYGHMMGDQILVAFAALLRMVFRENDVVYRLGGDEFGVFVNKLTKPQSQLTSMIERFSAKLDEEREHSIMPTMSVGAYAACQFHSFDDYYAKGDEALYSAKHEGRNTFCVKVEEL